MLSGLHRLAMAFAVALVTPTAAYAQRAEITQEIFDRQGLPGLVANPVPDGARGRVVAWRACAPAAPCLPIALEGPDDRFVSPGDAAPGTRFEVDVRADDGTVTSDRSLPWRGRVAATAPPAVGGALRVGAVARPVPATWAGGWKGDRSRLRLEACRDADGTRCETLSAQGEDPPVCPGAAAVIGRRYAGWWLRAVDERVAADTGFAGVGYLRARDIPVPRPFPTRVRSALAGPVARAAAGPFAECAAPEIQILRRARPQPSRTVFAYVTCYSACGDVLLVVRDARRTVRRRVHAAWSKELAVPAGVRLAGDTARVRVVVSGRHVARRIVDLR